MVEIIASGDAKASTLADVAARAGVSAKTVSRVVSGHPNVSPATRKKVEAAISDLDFQINHAARSLASARSFFIAIITTYVGSNYLAELYRGAIHAVRARGFHLAIEEISADADQLTGDLERCLRQIPYDGVILPPPLVDNADALDILDRNKIGYVRIAPATDEGRSHSVFADEACGVEQLVRHLWDMGHRRFAMITGPASLYATDVRSAAFARSIAELGGELIEASIANFIAEMSAVTTGYLATQRALAGKRRPTALFAFNDDMAAGAINCARELGFSVPGDLSIAGFDDSETARVTCPLLTSIHQPVADMSATAVNLLIDQPASAPAQCIVHPVRLVIRGSTDPSKSALDS